MRNLSLGEAAAAWGVSSRTAYRIAELGLVGVVRFGRRCVIPQEEVERVRLAGVPRLPARVDLPRRGRPRRAL